MFSPPGDAVNNNSAVRRNNHKRSEERNLFPLSIKKDPLFEKGSDLSLWQTLRMTLIGADMT